MTIQLIDSPFTNDFRQLQKVTRSAPLAMVPVAIDQISSQLGGLCHQQVELPLGQIVKLLKLNRSVEQVALEPLWIEFLGRDIQMQRIYV